MTTTSAATSSTVHISFLGILGQGGFGKVFLAEMATEYGFTQRIAVKVLHSEYGREPKLLSRLLDEARMLGVLNHRNIVKVYDVCEVNGQSAILMEYVDGRSLSELLKQGALTWGQTWQIVADCAQALADAYDAKHQLTGSPLYLIHRDIKPSNLLLSSSGTVKLLDFGIAKMNGVSESKTSTHQMGTARYMAPEQWLANQSSSSVDVYALARTALELLHGKFLPRTPLDRELHDQTLLQAVQQAPSSNVPKILTDTGRELLWSMLSYEPDQRPSIADVADRALGIAEAMGVVSLRGLMIERTVATDVRQSIDAVTEPIPFDLSSLDTKSLLSIVQGDAKSKPDLKAQDDSPSKERGLSAWGWLTVLSCLAFALWIFQGTNKPESHSHSAKALQNARTEGESDQTTMDPVPIVPKDKGEKGLMQPKQTLRISPEKSHSVGTAPSAASTHTVVISSLPLGAMVFIDGKAVGRTLLHNVALKEGSHRIELQLGEVRIERTVDVTEDIRFVWRANAANGTEEWSSFSP